MQRSRATIIDVARAAGVSKSTVANVIRDAPGVPIHAATRRRVLEAASRLGYRRNALAAAFASGQTGTIGILLPGHHWRATSRVLRTYGQDVFVAVHEAAGRAGLRVTSMPDLENRPDAIAELTDRRVDGLILASLRDPALVQAIYESDIPCVELGSGYGRRLIQTDNVGGAAQAVAHLVGLGHRRIAHFRGAPDHFAAERRFEGFVSACRDHDLSPDDCPVYLHPEEVEAALRSDPAQRPTALFAFNDWQAHTAVDIAHGLGLRVPADLSIVGFDNGVIAELSRPALTTIDNALDAQADAAVGWLRTLMARSHDKTAVPDAEDADDVPVPLCIPTRLVVRESTAAAVKPQSLRR